MFKKLPIVLGAAVLIAGCAKSADSIAPTYVSPITYQHFTCRQISAEMQRVSSRAAHAAGVQDDTATNDKVAMGVGLIIFWPSLFFLSGGNGANAADLARLKGSMDALEQAGIRKNCGIKIQRNKPAPRRQNRIGE